MIHQGPRFRLWRTASGREAGRHARADSKGSAPSDRRTCTDDTNGQVRDRRRLHPTPRQRWPPGMRQLAAVRGISRWQRGRATTGRSRPGAEGGSNARSRRGTHRPGSRNEPSVRRRPRPADPGAAARHLQPGCGLPSPRTIGAATGHPGVGGVDDCPHETPPSGFSVKVKGYAGRRVQTTSTSRLDLYGSHQERSASRPR